mmetsp:Transcript_28838/g.86584  ORF Transcript_28838/g.86584 Transcript_28838/m.86584 type:complete len:224 (+) Transcript_28838:1517-2188(+)
MVPRDVFPTTSVVQDVVAIDATPDMRLRVSVAHVCPLIPVKLIWALGRKVEGSAHGLTGAACPEHVAWTPAGPQQPCDTRSERMSPTLTPYCTAKALGTSEQSTVRKVRSVRLLKYAPASTAHEKSGAFGWLMIWFGLQFSGFTHGLGPVYATGAAVTAATGAFDTGGEVGAAAGDGGAVAQLDATRRFDWSPPSSGGKHAVTVGPAASAVSSHDAMTRAGSE